MNTNSDHIVIPAIANSESGKWNYASLIFSLFYFFPLYLQWSIYSVTDIFIIVICYGLFLACYLRATHLPASKALLPVAAIIITAGLTASVYYGANALFGFATFLSCYYFKPSTAWLYFVTNLGTQLLAALLFELTNIFFLGPSITVTIGMAVFGIMNSRDYVFHVKELRTAKQVEDLAAIAERERIARDMHDLLGHSLSSLALKSELAGKLIAKGDYQQASNEIEQVAELSRATLSEVRVAVTGMKQKGLAATLTVLCEQLNEFGFETDYFINVPPLDATTESTVILLCKEWITNILRHSQGNQVTVSLIEQAQRLKLNIKDNGTLKDITPGNGIQGMKSRVSELKGEWELSINDGVALNICLPLQQ